MKRRGFLKNLLLVGVTAAISTEITFRAFKHNVKGGVFNQIDNTHKYKEATISELEEWINDVFIDSESCSNIQMWATEEGLKEFDKVMKEESKRYL